MPTVSEAFATYIQALEITATEREVVARQRDALRERLRAHVPGVARDVLAGAYARDTAIRPLDDVALLLVLEPRHPRPKPLALLQELRYAPAARIRGRAVHVDGFDVIPAFAAGGAVYEIPDLDDPKWIRTNPVLHQQRCSDANRRLNQKLIPLVKLVKRWNRELLRGFHVEAMMYDFAPEPSSFSVGLAKAFAFLAKRVQLPCRDPAGLGPELDEALAPDERTRAAQQLAAAAQVAAQALDLERRGEHEQAIARWELLLGRQR